VINTENIYVEQAPVEIHASAEPARTR
jgi:hypothetical protein